MCMFETKMWLIFFNILFLKHKPHLTKYKNYMFFYCFFRVIHQQKPNHGSILNKPPPIIMKFWHMFLPWYPPTNVWMLAQEKIISIGCEVGVKRRRVREWLFARLCTCLARLFLPIALNFRQQFTEHYPFSFNLVNWMHCASLVL